MNRKFSASLIIISLVVGVTLASVLAAQRQRTLAASVSDVASYLPASDAIVIVDMRRLLTETMPSILAGDRDKLSQANADLEKFKTRTGVDLRSFDRVIVGLRYAPSTPRTETVAIAHGAFDAKALSAAARSTANGKYREEHYHGATITIISVNDQIKLAGLWNVKVNELAICAVDQNSLALGNPASVRAAIDAGKRGRVSADLISLATRDPNAVIGFAGNVSRETLAKLDVGNDTMAKDIGSIRQFYGAVGSTQTDLTMMIVARTISADAAKNLGDTVEGLRQLGAIFITRMPQPRKTLAQSALDNLKVTARGNDVEIRTQVAATNLAALIK